MLPDWISRLGVKYDKMDKSSKNSERSLEEGQKQILDFDVVFLNGLHSTRAWNDGISLEDPFFSTNDFVTLPKKESSPKSKDTPLKVVEMHVEKDTPIEWTNEYKELDLEKKIETYNSIAKEEKKITLHEDGINFGGSISVSNFLCRQIEVVEWLVPQPVNDVMNTAKLITEPTPTVKIAPFALPKNSVALINIDSKTTARQIIMKMFRKYRMVNYPRKYALYEYVEVIDKTAGTLTTKWTQIPDNACPLKVVLNWPITRRGYHLVLREKEIKGIPEDIHNMSLREIFSMVSGLNTEQVAVQKQKNLRTGLYETRISKRDPPVYQQNRKMPPVREQVLVFFILMVFVAVVFIFGFAVGYETHDNSLPREEVCREFTRGILKRNLEEMFEKFKEE